MQTLSSSEDDKVSGVTTMDEQIEAVAYTIAEAALEKKALDVMILDVRSLVNYCDYFILASGRGERQVQAIADGVGQVMAEAGYKPRGQEGLTTGLWGILDYGDVVFHIFRQDERDKYALERLWGDAPRLELEVPAELQTPSFGGISYDR